MTNLEKYIAQVRYIQANDDRWCSERQDEEHIYRRELRAKLTPEEVLEANRILGWR